MKINIYVSKFKLENPTIDTYFAHYNLMHTDIKITGNGIDELVEKITTYKELSKHEVTFESKYLKKYTRMVPRLKVVDKKTLKTIEETYKKKMTNIK
ncbi:MAG: hypothetical protein ACP5NV_05115 [Candidatus Woesearchaeota archaeon]